MIKEKITKLLEIIKRETSMLPESDRTSIYNFIEERLQKFPNYMVAVINMEYQKPILLATKDGEAFALAWKELESTKKIALDSAVESCQQLNRLCDQYNVAKICTIDTTDRKQVAIFAGEMMCELFSEGIAPSEGKPA